MIKKILLGVLVLFGLGAAGVIYLWQNDQKRMSSGTNRCENACLADSGGVEFCRKQCADPNNYFWHVPDAKGTSGS